MLGKSLLITVCILFLATSCSSGNEQASSEPTVSPSTEIITSSPTPDPTPTPAVSSTTEPSMEPDPTPTSSKQPKTKESKSLATPSAAPKKSKAPSKPSPSTKKLTNAELALKYPPTIGTLVPWYFPTPEQAGKAYTDLKPYETGKTYALYQEENSLLLVYPGVGTTYLDGDTVVWGAIRINRIKAEEITIDENMVTSYGMQILGVLVCEGAYCDAKISRNIMHIELIPKNLPGVYQEWTPIYSNILI